MVEIREVQGKRARRKFVKYPLKLYKGVEQYVPNFYGDDLNDWGPKNPALAYCESKAFLAYNENGEIVGRIGAIISHAANEKWGTKRMRFSQVDFIDDPEVSEALFNRVEEWAKEKGCDEVHGPLGFTDLDREGMLIDGYDVRSCFFTYYNYPYYNDHLEKLGYRKDVDWVEQRLDVDTAKDGYEYYKKIADFVLKHNNLHLAEVHKQKEYVNYIAKVFNLVNICYKDLYSTVELSEDQIQKYAKKFAPLIDPDFACFVLDDNNNLVAFGVLASSMEEALKKSKGKLFPLGWIGILRSLKKATSLDMLLVAVHPDYQKKGVNAILIEHAIRNALKRGVVFAETGPQLEDNEMVQAQWKAMGPYIHKRRRCYIKQL